jgi:N,N'-diacetyllegionaminate synthase
MNKKIIIIAEAGVNHNGSLDLAKKLIEVASNSGADYVKFQTFKAHKLVTKSAKKAEYQSSNYNDGNDLQFDMLKKLELSESDHLILIEHAKKNSIQFLSTGFDEESVDFLDNLKMPLFKIPSGEINNLPFLRHIAKKKKPVILSTGLANIYEIKDALDILTNAGLLIDQITVLHCTTEYPAPYNEVNLLAMYEIEKKFKVKIGYSDHTEGIEISLAAAAMGASVIEKHFTLDKNMEGPDHKASLEPKELYSLVKGIRNIEMAKGDGIKRATNSELKNINIARKSIVAKEYIKKGDIITEDKITVKRPGTGLSPMLWDQVINIISTRDYNPDDQIEA